MLAIADVGLHSHVHHHKQIKQCARKRIEEAPQKRSAGEADAKAGFQADKMRDIGKNLEKSLDNIKQRSRYQHKLKLPSWNGYCQAQQAASTWFRDIFWTLGENQSVDGTTKKLAKLTHGISTATPALDNGAVDA